MINWTLRTELPTKSEKPMVQRCWIMRLQIVLLQNRWDIRMCPPHVNCITTVTKIIRLKFIRSAKQLTFRKRNTKEQKYISMKVSEAAKIKAYETFCFFKIIKTYQKTNQTIKTRERRQRMISYFLIWCMEGRKIFLYE